MAGQELEPLLWLGLIGHLQDILLHLSFSVSCLLSPFPLSLLIFHKKPFLVSVLKIS